MNAAGRFTYLSARCRCSLVLLYNIFLYRMAFDSSLQRSVPRLNFISCITEKKTLTVLVSDRRGCNNSWLFC